MARHLSMTTRLVLSVLQEIPSNTGGWYGRPICQRTGLGSGTVYPILARLEKDGLITSRLEKIDTSKAGRPARRYYRLTSAGHTAAVDARCDLEKILGVISHG